MIEVNLSKQQPPDANPKAIQKNIFTENLEGARNKCFWSLKKQRKVFSIFQIESKFILLEYNVNIKWLSITVWM